MGWGKQDCAIVVRGAICAMLSVSKRRATPHPTGFAGNLPQPKLGKGSARRFEMCEYRRVRPRGESNPGDDGLRLSPWIAASRSRAPRDEADRHRHREPERSDGVAIQGSSG